MSSSKTQPALQKSDQETLRELSNLAPHESLKRIAAVLRFRFNCETACILVWHELWPKDRKVRKGGRKPNEVLITEYDEGMPESLGQQEPHSEIYGFGEGITGGYIFEQQRAIRARIDLAAHKIYDDETGAEVKVEGTKWGNMERFGRESKYGDFKSLLGLPLIVKNQWIGVVKLINKLDESGSLAADGFTPKDLERLKNFLLTIELVIETKTNEKQTENLFKINQRVTSADFNYGQLLQEIARSCADTLNLRICVIRLLDHGRLQIQGNSLGLAKNGAFEGYEISEQVLQKKSELKLTGDELRTFINSLPTDNVKTGKVFGPQGYDIKSFLAVRVIYQEKAIGVIECYTFLAHDFSNHEINTVRAYGTLVATLFQRNRIKDAIAGLVQSFSLLSSPGAVYGKVMDLIQQYLGTSAISIWERNPTPDGFVFELARASDWFLEKYQRHEIQTLTESSLTAKVANANKTRHFTWANLRKESLEHRKFVDENNLKSVTIVPITIGGQANAVIDVFYDEDRKLLKEEADFLNLLAGKAAAAIWNKKLTLSFKAISDVLLSAPDIGTVLERIANVAREVLYADLVILFRYDSARREFLRPKWSGLVFTPKGIYKGEKEKQTDFVNLMLGEEKPLYLVGMDAYKRFCQDKGTVRPWRLEDFWHREGISSMAAVRLDDSRGRPTGVMFFNYRSEFNFDDSTKQVIESFASQAAFAMVSAGFKGMRNQELLSEQMTVGLLDQLAACIDSLNFALARVNEGRETNPNSVNPDHLLDLVNQRDVLRLLNDRVIYYRNHFTLDSDFDHRNVNDLIENTLAVFSNRFDASGLTHEFYPQEDLPKKFCDSLQIPGMFYQLISILLDTKSSNRGHLTITTGQPEPASIDVEMTLTGGRVGDEELQSILSQPIFGSGKDNLPKPGRFEFCEVLAQSHRGHIEIRRDPDGLYFKVNLPLE